MYYFCKCPQDCGNGYVGFWRCADGMRIILRCDECEASWSEPAEVLTKNPALVSSPDYLWPGTNIPVYGEKAGWAGREKIDSVGWTSFIKGESTALDEIPKRFTCPSCGYPDLQHAPYKTLWGPPVPMNADPPYFRHYGEPSYDVCHCCGFEFGNDDDPGTAPPKLFEAYLAIWIKDGCIWFDPAKKPANWTLEQQLKNAGLTFPGKART
jgi:hypothetical protein